MLDWWNSFAGIGGWFLVLLLDAGLTSWVLFDSPRRKGQTVGWRVAMVVLTLLILPSAAAGRLGGVSYQTREALSWVGLVFGGMLTLASALSYWILVVNAPRLPAVAPAAPAPDPAPEPAQAPAGPAPAREEAGAALVLAGQDPAREFRLYRGDMRIGRRKQGNDVVLDDISVSREHALIREEHGYFTLYDLGSLAGTLVNGQRVKGPTLLEDGDELALGDLKLRFVILRP